jgi:beta-N-acetylhexosaminidase
MRMGLFAIVWLVILVGTPTIFSFQAVDSAVNYEEIKEPLSLEEAVGQMLFISVEGTEVTQELASFLEIVQPGGIVLFQRNIQSISQVQTFISELNEHVKHPLFVAVDQEGGIVSRIWWGETTPQAALENQVDAVQVGKARAKNLESLGVNMNLAPVIDSRNPFDYVFPRAFQGGDLKVAGLAAGLIQSHRQGGVIPVPKHYPGYDGIFFDPEAGTIPRAKDFPAKESFLNLFFSSAPDILMLSHVVYEEVDAEYPLPFSSLGIERVRKEVGKEVLLMSDDLLSRSFQASYSPEEIGALALAARVDIFLVVGDPDPTLIANVREGLLKGAVEHKDRVLETASRILELKLALFGAQ